MIRIESKLSYGFFNLETKLTLLDFRECLHTESTYHVTQRQEIMTKEEK